MAHDNKTLGTFHLDGIPPAPRGVPQIEVAFDIDANGILNVSAKDLGTGKDQKITITGSSSLSPDEVDRMTKEAELHAEEDKKKREAVEAHNQLDSTIYQMEKMMKESGDKLPEDKKGELESAIAEAKKDLESDDSDRMKGAMERLSKIGAELYQAAAAAGQPGEAGDPGAPEAAAEGGQPEAGGAESAKPVDPDVVDADFEVVDDDKKS